MVVEILTGAALIIALVNLIFNILIWKKVKFNELRMNNQMNQSMQTEGIVFCRKCNNKYSAVLNKCPMCGETRR